MGLPNLLLSCQGLRLDIHNHTHCIPLWLERMGSSALVAKLSRSAETCICFLPIARWHKASHTSGQWKAIHAIPCVRYYLRAENVFFCHFSGCKLCVMHPLFRWEQFICPYCSIGLPFLFNRLNSIWLIIEAKSLLCWGIVHQNTIPVTTTVLFHLGNLKRNLLVRPNYVVRAFLPLLAFHQ